MTRKQAVINGRKGGLKSVQVRRQKKELKELLLLIFSCKVPIETITDEVKKELFKDMDIDEAIIYSQIIKAINGDTQAAIFIRDTAGQKPTDKQEIKGQLSVEELLRKVTSEDAY